MKDGAGRQTRHINEAANEGQSRPMWPSSEASRQCPQQGASTNPAGRAVQGVQPTRPLTKDDAGRPTRPSNEAANEGQCLRLPMEGCGCDVGEGVQC